MQPASKQEIIAWFERGVDERFKYLIVRCDTFSHEDYPKYAHTLEQARTIAADASNMQETHEVYDLEKDMMEQVNQHRCWSI